MKASETKERVMKVIKGWSAETTGGFDGYWHGYEMLCDETGAPVSELKRIMKELSKDGCVELRPTYNTDGVLCGRGWFATDSIGELK